MKPVLKGMAVDDLHTSKATPTDMNSFHNLAPTRKVSLRSMSKSDPHLDVPHLIVSQDEEHPSLNRVLSSLFHADTALRTPTPSNSNLLMTNTDSHLQGSASSAALLTSESQPTTGVLRKSSSAIDWSHVLLGERKISQTQQFAPFALPSGEQHNNLAVDIPQQPVFKGGLVMSSSPERQNQVMPSAYAQQLSVVSPTASAQLAVPSSITSNSSAPNLVQQANVEKPHNDNHSYFGGMFNRGFFARPVIRSEEENYRYLYALDR